MSIARRILLASVVLSLLVSAAFVTLILAITALREANEREARASEVTTATLRLEKLVVDLETGLRGLVLTGNERFLQPYAAARRPAAARGSPSSSGSAEPEPCRSAARSGSRR